MNAPSFRPKIFRFLLLLSFCNVFPAHAAITLDGSLGPSGSLSGPNYAITPDFGRQIGANLFHSFGSFNLSNGESATFTGPTSITNIVGRVTGGGASSIDGLLRSTIPGASLYLINPDGLIFGPNAALELGGSFYGSSASYVSLADGGRFDATAPANSVLTSAPPAAFGFLGNPAGDITVNGSRLVVGNGEQLVLAGGALNIHGQGNAILNAPGGKVGLYAVASEGEIGLAGVRDHQPSRYGDIRIDDGAKIRADGSNGSIFIRAGRLEMANSSLLAQNAGSEGGIRIDATDSVELDGAILQSATNGAAKGGTIAIETGRLAATNQSLIDTSTFGPGEGGRISVKAGDLTLTNDSSISNLVNEDGTGHGGNTAIHVSGTMSLSGHGAVLNSSFGGGNAGQLEIEAGRLIISGGTLQAAAASTGQAGTIHIKGEQIELDAAGIIHVATNGLGDGGTIVINASHLTLSEDARINAQSTGSGRAGEIDIHTGTLDLRDGASISNRTYYFQQRAGDIRVDAAESVHIRGRSESKSPNPGSDEVSTGIFSYTGNIAVVTPELVILDSGGISTRTWNDLRSGNLSVETDRLTLLNGGHISADAIGSSAYYGGAGDVTVHASESILISGMAGDRRSGIQSGTRSSGDAGSIKIFTPRLRIEDDGMINAGTGVFGEGAAGSIMIQAGNLEVFSRGRILSSSSGYGGGGDITVSADSITLDDGYISAFGSGSGVAGQISLRAPSVVMRGGLVNTETASGARAGDILIEADNLNLGAGSRIKSDSSSSGNAGNILLRANNLLAVDDSTITTGAAHASGGNIDIRAKSLTLANNSAVTATVGGGAGDGGNVTITAEGVAAVENSDITARADQGHGGRIAIDSNVFLRTLDVDLDASSNVSGNEGVVEVNAPMLDISGSLVVLPASFLDASALLSDPCAVSHAGQASSFVIRGRGGIPAQPDAPLPASLPFDASARQGAKTDLPWAAPLPAADCQRQPWKESHL